MKNKELIVFMALSVLGCSSSVDDEPLEVSRIEHQVENDAVLQYNGEVDYLGRDYSSTEMQRYDVMSRKCREDLPNSLTYVWDKVVSSDLATLLGVVSSGERHDTVVLGAEPYVLWNVTPGETVDVKLVEHGGATGESVGRTVWSQSVSVQGQIRMLAVDGVNVGNFRDLGGWSVRGGGRICYGKLIRGAEVFRDDGKLKIAVSEVGMAELIDRLHVSVELDFGDFSDYSPLEERGVKFCHGRDYAIAAYEKGLSTDVLRRRYYNCINLIANELAEGHVIYFHCNAGADRTGTLAFILEALLGVDESNLSKDYELTSFSCLNTPRYRNNESFSGLVSYIKDNFAGDTLNEKVESLCLLPIEAGGIGLSTEALELLRDQLIVKE